MKQYKRYSDSTLMRLTKAELIEYIRMAEHNQDAAEETVRQQAENMKDWEPITRCKDCKNAYQNQFGKADKTVECTLLRNSCGWPIIRKENDYCSDGEPVKRRR